MRHSDALFGVAALFIAAILFVYFTFLPTPNNQNQLVAYLSLICIMLLSLSLYAGVVGLIVAVRWSSTTGGNHRKTES